MKKRPLPPSLRSAPPLSREQALTLLRGLDDPASAPVARLHPLAAVRDRAFFGALLYTWAPVSALQGLRAEDVLSASDRLRFPHSDSFREIPLHPHLKLLLGEHLESLSEIDDAPLFASIRPNKTSLARRPLSEIALRNLIHQKVAQFGLPPRTSPRSFQVLGIQSYLDADGDPDLIPGILALSRPVRNRAPIPLPPLPRLYLELLRIPAFI